MGVRKENDGMKEEKKTKSGQFLLASHFHTVQIELVRLLLARRPYAHLQYSHACMQACNVPLTALRPLPFIYSIFTNHR